MTTTGEVLKPTREELIAFLNGSGSIDGLWFGEQDKFHRGYWWRKYLDVLSAPQGNAAQGWSPIESAPKDGEYLVYMPKERKKYQVMYAHPNVNLIGNCFAFDMTKPSHWQPLPAAPSNKEVER